MANISDRIAQIIAHTKISTRAFEQQIGCSNGVIARCIGKGTDISSLWVSKIVESYPFIDPGWLLTGHGSMLKRDVLLGVKSKNTTVSSDKDTQNEPNIQRNEDSIIYKMYKDQLQVAKEEKEEKEKLLKENGRLEERLRQLESSSIRESNHPPLIEKIADAFTPDSLGGSGKDFIRTRNPVPSKTSSVSKT